MSDRGPRGSHAVLLIQVVRRTAMDLEEGMNCSLCFTMYFFFFFFGRFLPLYMFFLFYFALLLLEVRVQIILYICGKLQSSHDVWLN